MAADGHISIRLPKKAVFAALTAALVLGLGECGFRVSDELKERRAAARAGADLQSVEAQLASGRRVSDRAGAIALVHHPYLGVRPERGSLGGERALNAQGFRGADFARERRAGVGRVIVTGGSAVFGLGASDDRHTIPSLLEQKLGARAEVLNAGVMSYMAAQELVLFATELAPLAPDVVVIYDGWNDLEVGRTSDAARPLYPTIFWQFDDLAERSFDPVERVIGWSALYRGVRRKLSRAKYQTLYETRRASGGEALHPDAIPGYARALTQYVRLVRANGARAVVCVQPEVYSKKPLHPAEAAVAADRPDREYAAARYGDLVEAARAVAAAEGVEFLDGRKAFEGVAEQVFFDAVHLNDRGNEIVAGFLEPAVRRALEGAAQR